MRMRECLMSCCGRTSGSADNWWWMTENCAEPSKQVSRRKVSLRVERWDDLCYWWETNERNRSNYTVSLFHCTVRFCSVRMRYVRRTRFICTLFCFAECGPIRLANSVWNFVSIRKQLYAEHAVMIHFEFVIPSFCLILSLCHYEISQV